LPTDHLGSRMKGLDTPQNGGSVVSDNDLSLGGLDLDRKRVQIPGYMKVPGRLPFYPFPLDRVKF
jgi:hypothetical protein